MKRATFRGSVVNLVEAAERLGVHRNFFYIMRFHAPQKYAYLEKLADNTVDAYRRYLDEYTGLRQRVEALYFALAESEEIKKFGEYLCQKGVYRHSGGFSAMVHSGFSRENSPSLRHLQKLREIVKLGDAYMGGDR